MDYTVKNYYLQLARLADELYPTLARIDDSYYLVQVRDDLELYAGLNTEYLPFGRKHKIYIALQCYYFKLSLSI
jgi:hypothetical protein